MRTQIRSFRTLANRVVPRLAALWLVLVCCSTQSAASPITVVTTTPTLAEIAREIGGERVEVSSILAPDESMHVDRPRRAPMGDLRRADFLIVTGLDAEPWIDDLLRRAGNSRITPGSAGHVDASEGIDVIDADAGAGGHPRGNPHYLLDPWNGLIVADTIAEALAAAAPIHTAEFRANATDFAERVRALAQEMEARLEPLAGTDALSHHATWDYVLTRFGMVSAGALEESPGAAVNARRLNELAESLKMQPPAFAIVESGDDRMLMAVAKKLQSVPVRLATEVGADRGVATYEDLMRFNLNALLAAHARWRGGVSTPEKVTFP